MKPSSGVSPLFSLAALLLALVAALAVPPGASAQDSNSSVEVHDRICPVEYQGDSWFEDCHGTVPDPGLPFTFTNEDTGDVYSDTTNADGNVGFANLSSGTYTISGGAPGDFADHVVYCAIGTEGASNQEQIPVEYVTVGVQLELPADTNVICDWYEIPYDLQSQPPAPTETPAVSQEQFDLPIFALLCDTDPGATAATNFVMMGAMPQGCEQYAGASVTVSTQDGSAYGTCETTATGPCAITVATGTTVVTTIDPSTLPADTTVLGGTTHQVEIVRASEAWVLFVAVPAVQTPVPTVPTPTTAPLPEGRTLAIHEGACPPRETGDIVAELTDLRGAEPVPGSDADVVIAETSSSVLDMSLGELMDGGYAVIAYSDEGTETPVACTRLGGEQNLSGELVLGLKEVDASGYTGIVYLAPSGDGSQTGVSVFLAEGLASDDAGIATPGG